jgi:hypothetical protein
MINSKNAFYEKVRWIAALLCVIYFFTFGLLLIQGIKERITGTSCTKPVVKGEILLPAFRLGCWLGEPIK